ncbi:CBS domain-containing protein [Nocardiopsis baichengensis]|uniref:CBS domain-containing protein n=1 Tax=Nocardiopsis baichengensis TaxID=280240 RepID=UPI00034540DA|nr:CBS domain-containing protein [Nocardiopsis baichengensis]
MTSSVSRVMATDVVSVGEDAGYKEVVDVLVAHAVSAVPVVDAEGRAVGVVSEEDLLHKEEFKDEDASDDYRPPLRARLRARLEGAGLHAHRASDKAAASTARELMSAPPVTASPDTSVVRAARLMERHGVKRLPVVDDRGRLVGLVTRRDLLRVFDRADGDIAAQVRRELDETLGPDAGRAVAASVDDGRVRLTGRVNRRSDAELLVRRAGSVEGVVSVDDALKWRVDDIVPPHVQWRTP